MKTSPTRYCRDGLRRLVRSLILGQKQAAVAGNVRIEPTALRSP